MDGRAWAQGADPGAGSAASPLRAQGRSSGRGHQWSGIWNYAHLLEKRQHARAQGVRLGRRSSGSRPTCPGTPPDCRAASTTATPCTPPAARCPTSTRRRSRTRRAGASVGRPVAAGPPGAFDIRDDAFRRSGLGVGRLGAPRRQQVPGHRPVAELDALQPPRPASGEQVVRRRRREVQARKHPGQPSHAGLHLHHRQADQGGRVGALREPSRRSRRPARPEDDPQGAAGGGKSCSSTTASRPSRTSPARAGRPSWRSPRSPAKSSGATRTTGT